MEGCLFCAIALGRVPAAIVYSDERIVAFKDINPQAPLHLLVIPREHHESLNTIQDRDLAGYILCAAAKLAHEHGIARTGYRVVFNCNSDGGQTVFHLHAHLLGGRAMHWPPG